MPNLSELLRERDRHTSEARQLVETAETRGEAPGEREAARLEELRKAVDGLDQRIRAQAVLDDMDRSAPGRTVAGDAAFDRELRNFNLNRLMASTFDPSIDAGRERELAQETARRAGRSTEGFLVPFAALVPQRPERRVLTAGSGGGAAGLVQETVMGAEFIDALRPQAVVGRLGARMISGLRGDVALPKRSSRNPAPAWFAENAPGIGTGDQSFVQVTGTPRHLGLITEFSRKTLLQTTPDIEALTREHLLAELAIGLDLAALKGSGDAPVPRGVVNVSGIHEVEWTSHARLWADACDVVAKVEGANVAPTASGWAMNAATKARLRTAFKLDPALAGIADAAPFIVNDAAGGLVGSPIAVTSQLAGDPTADPAVAGEAIFGAWDQLIIAMWSGVEILVNPYESTAYAKGNVSVRAILDADIMVRHPEAFCHWTGIDLVVPTPE